MTFISSLKSWPYWSQFAAIISASLAIISCGMDYGWPSPAVPLLFSSNSPIQPIPDDSQITYVANVLSSLYMGGGVCSLPVTFIMTIYLGRKITILIAIAVGLICWIIIACVNSLELLYFARLITGMAANTMYVVVPMYIAECSQPQIRGTFGSLVYINMMIGILTSYLIIPFMPIWGSCLLPICLNVISLTSFYYQPETPYFLLKRSQMEAAKKSLEYLRSDEDVSNELSEICAAVARQEAERGRLVDLFVIPSNLKASMIMLLLNTAQNMAGVAVIVMNAQYLLQEAADLAGEEPFIAVEFSAIIFAAVMLIAGSFGSLLIDRFGRNFLLISSGILTSFFLALLAAYYGLSDVFVQVHLTWIPLCALVGYAFSFKFGLGLVPIVTCGELFPSSVKILGMVFADLVFALMATVSIEFFHLIVEPLGLFSPFVVFSFCSALTSFLVWIYVPETKGKTLEEVQMILKKQTEKTPNNIDNTPL